jgi:hypothetical protein
VYCTIDATGCRSDPCTTAHVAEGILCGVPLRHCATIVSIFGPGLWFRFRHAAMCRGSVEFQSCCYEGRRDFQMLSREGIIRLTWLSPIRSSGLWLKSAFESGLQRKSAAVELSSGGLSEKRCRLLSPLFLLCRVENMGRRMLSVFPHFE